MFLQITPKKKTTAHRPDKRKKIDNTRFHSTQHFERYNQFFKKAPISQERFVDLVDLKDYFIPGCFQDRGWDKLLGDLLEVCEPLIHEFYANTTLRDDEMDCWIRDHKFTIDLEDIDDVLGFEDIEHDFTHYKDKMISLNTIAFPSELRCFTLIMMFNLYPVKKMTNINNARAIFLMEFREKTYIDLVLVPFFIIANETRTTSRPKIILPSFLMRHFHAKGVEIPQDISLMSTPSTINALTIARIEVRLPGDEEEVGQAQGEPMDTKTEVER